LDIEGLQNIIMKYNPKKNIWKGLE